MSGKVTNIIRISILFLLLLLPIFYSLCVAVDLEYSILKKCAYLWVVLILLLIPALFLKAKTYFIVQGIFNFLFFPIDIASLYLNKQSTSVAFLQNILRTDMQEASELLVSLWPLCTVVGILYIVYFVLAFRVENKPLIPDKLRKILLISAVVAVFAGLTVFTIYGRMRDKTASATELIYDAIDLSYMKLYKIYPYNLYLELADIAIEYNYQQKLSEQVSSFSFGIQPQTNDSSALYILVIGEAVRYDHLGINGYERNTTPLLSKQKNLISYDSVFAQANLTSRSVPMILTRATADNVDVAYKEKSISGAFKEAGYLTGYITKQQPLSVETRIMNNSDYAFSYSKALDVDGNYDGDMVDKLSEYVADTLQYFTLHMLGNHFRYEQRYPVEFEVFTPVMGKSFSYASISEENKDKLINAYDNCILYLDYFLDELITYVDSLNRSAVIVYISDHGESLWDDERKLSLHGSYDVAKYEYHVPMLVWYSDEYAVKNLEKVSNINDNSSKPISSDAIFYSLLDMACVKEVVDSTKSFASQYLQPIDSLWVLDGKGEKERISVRNF